MHEPNTPHQAAKQYIMKIDITLYREDLINPYWGFDDINLSKFKIDRDLVLKAHQIVFVDDDGRYRMLKSR